LETIVKESNKIVLRKSKVRSYHGTAHLKDCRIDAHQDSLAEVIEELLPHTDALMVQKKERANGIS